MKTIVGIDPSINLCGYAIIYDGSLIDFGLIETPSEMKLETKCQFIARFLKKKISTYEEGENITVAIEMPQTWSSSYGIAAKSGGALQKLFFCVGVLYGKLNYGNNKVRLIPVSSWKGNVPKTVTFKRMSKKYDLKMKPTQKNFNVFDAIGIADYVLEGEKKKGKE